MKFGSQPSSKLAAAFVIVGSILIVISLAFLRWSETFTLTVPADPRISGLKNDVDAQPLAARMGALYLTLLWTFVLFMVFLLGSFIIARVLRVARRRSVGGEQTEYVDAWRMYRLTEADLARATAEPRATGGGPEGDADREDRPDEPPPDDAKPQS
ncbi:MAG: hypothetical protein U1D55_07920 [Phycisphaerae bacterium]